MKICASLGKASDLERAGKADMVEIRMDLLGSVPDTRGKETIVTFRDGFDVAALPEGFDGLVDVGESEIPDVPFGVISSYHDYDGTPSSETIVSKLGSMGGDIVKGAFLANGFVDLENILKASKALDRKHVLVGMGPFGAVTRVRQKALGNEFTFARVGEPTAPGQLSLDVMSRLGDDCTVTGLVGKPLGKSMSPEMHSAAYSRSGIAGVYLAFETDSVESMEECIAGYGIRGLNVTMPLKTEAIGIADPLDADAERAGALNTLLNDSGKIRGFNTDVYGVEKAIAAAGGLPDGGNVLIMGCGGSARASAVAALNMGADVTFVSRNDASASSLAGEMGVSWVPRKSDASEYDAVINCTPVGMYGRGEYPADVESLAEGSLVLDMVYGHKIQLTEIASEKGCRFATGEDVLAHQGAKSFEIWTSVGGMFETMREAIRRATESRTAP